MDCLTNAYGELARKRICVNNITFNGMKHTLLCMYWQLMIRSCERKHLFAIISSFGVFYFSHFLSVSLKTWACRRNGIRFIPIYFCRSLFTICVNTFRFLFCLKHCVTFRWTNRQFSLLFIVCLHFFLVWNKLEWFKKKSAWWKLNTNHLSGLH